MAETKKEKAPKITGAERKQHGPFKKRRAGVVLSKDEVIRIKAGRKKLRRDMRKMGVKSKKEFELTASSLGLYFDKNRRIAVILWWLLGKGGWLLLGLAVLGMLVFFGFSYMTQLQGHFTISMSDELFLEGFSLSETKGFENPTSHLFAPPAEGVPCVSITNISEDVFKIDGSHNGNYDADQGRYNGDYFAYTFYVRNEGESTQNLRWQFLVNSESHDVSDATWAMLFVDGQMTMYAEADDQGNPEMLPAAEDNSQGYLTAPFYDQAAAPEELYEVVDRRNNMTYWRVKPEKFLTGTVVDTDVITEFQPEEVHCFTVVLWLEGDDPHCTDELIGGHMGMEFQLDLLPPEEE